MFVNHNLSYRQPVSLIFHVNFAQQHVNTFSLLILPAPYQHHQKHGKNRSSSLCCERTAKWARVESCGAECSWMRMNMKKLFHLTLGMLPPSAQRENWGLHVKVETKHCSNQRVGQRTSLTCTELHDFLGNKLLERRLEPIFEPVLKFFQLKMFTTFNGAVGYTAHRWTTETGRFDAPKKPRWIARAEARRPTFDLGQWIGENSKKIWWIFWISPPPKCLIFGAFFWGPRRNGQLCDGPKWIMIMKGNFRKPLQPANRFGMISLRSTRPCESGCSRWGDLDVFFFGGTWRPKYWLRWVDRDGLLMI